MEEVDTASREFVKLIEQLSRRIVDAADALGPSQRNEEWTKISFIHRQIIKGLKLSEDRGASYFIWTNGDCWQFFSLALPGAPIYSLTLSDVHDDHEQIEHIADRFRLIDKASLSANPKLFDEALRENWKTAALPAALDASLNEHAHEFVQLFRRGLPDELDIKDEEILTFLRELKLPSLSAPRAQKGPRRIQQTLSFPEDWQELLDSSMPKYERARKRFRKVYYRKLAQYLLGDQYSPWSKKTTWRHVGTSRDPNERKRLGNVIALFRKWHFIEDAEGIDMYQRVEKSVPYLRKLFEEPVNP